MPLKTLFLNPPSFENFDGGAGSRWPATREIESYWYPVWLAYPTGMLEGARLLDAPPHHITAEETIRTCKDYELLVLFTSTPGFPGDVRIAEAIKDSQSAHQDCLRRTARQRAARKVADGSKGNRRSLPQGIRLLHRRIRPRQAARRHSRHFLSQERRGRAQSRPSDDSRIWTPCRTSPTSTAAIWTSAATTCRSCFTRSYRSTPPADARRSAPSACGRRRSADTRGASVPPTTWLVKWRRRKNTGRT